MSSDGNSSDKDFVNTAISGYVNFMTRGLVGYDGGKFGEGILTHAVDEGVGEMTGRNQARHQMNLAQENLDKEEANRNAQITADRVQKEHADISASSQAQAFRNTARAQSTAQGTKGLLGDKDFLGL